MKKDFNVWVQFKADGSMCFAGEYENESEIWDDVENTIALALSYFPSDTDIGYEIVSLEAEEMEGWNN